MYFYPRSPYGERPKTSSHPHNTKKFLSTLSLRRATRWQRGVSCYDGISIHALLTESDDGFEGCQQLIGDISIHALLTESDHHQSDYLYLGQQFLSTLSLRRATLSLLRSVRFIALFLSTLSLRRATSALGGTTMLEVYFYPRSPYGERPRALCMVGPSAYFYPRSTYGERLLYISRLTTAQIFLSTLSLRRAT